MNKKATIGLAMAAIVASGVFFTMAVSGLLVSSQTVSNSGIIASANIGLYSDLACTQSLSSISWGTVSPGSSISRTVYVKNTGSLLLTLSLSETGWNPTSAYGPISLSWDRENVAISANQVMSATFTMTISSNTNGVTSFSFSILVSGTA